MPYPELTVIAIDPGGTTGWAKIIVPRKSLYGDEKSKVLDWDAGEVHGPENEQVKALAGMVRSSQGLSYLVGPAVIIEDFELRTQSRGKEVLSPVRIAAKLDLMRQLGLMGDSLITYQSASLAKSTVTDDRLKRWGFWVAGQDHARDALRHAITALRRARANPEVRDDMWADANNRNDPRRRHW